MYDDDRRVDLGAEDYEFPTINEIDPSEAAKLWDAMEREARLANARADRLKKRKAAAKELALRAIEASPFTSVRFPGPDGRDVQMTPYAWTVFRVVNEEQFKEWAAGERERYYDDTPRLRNDVFLEEMRRRDTDKEPLPPGVTSWTDTKISRNAVAQKKPKNRSRD